MKSEFGEKHIALAGLGGVYEDFKDSEDELLRMLWKAQSSY